MNGTRRFSAVPVGFRAVQDSGTGQLAGGSRRERARTARAVAGLLVAGGLACTAPLEAPEHAFDPEAYSEVAVSKVIYVAPPDYLSKRFTEHEAVLELFERTLSAYLMTHGFDVQPSSEFRNAWKVSETQLGGLFSTRTGRVDREKLDQCLSDTIRRLETLHEFSAVLLPRVIYHTVDLEPPYTTAAWDGVRRKMTFEGGFPNTRWTNVLAMSFEATLITKSGRVAYEAVGGLDFAHKCVLEDGKIHLVPKEVRGYDPEDLEEGIDVTLGPLISR